MACDESLSCTIQRRIFFPLLHIIESGLFISGYFLQKLNRENPFYPRTRNSVETGEFHKEFNTTYKSFFSTERSFLGFTEDSFHT